MHRRRVYLEHGATRKARMEGWLTFSILLSTVVLMLSLLVCLPDMISVIVGWFLSARPSSDFGAATPHAASASVVLCEFLTVISGGYLVIALYIKANIR
jgi:hypothetical protein